MNPAGSQRTETVPLGAPPSRASAQKNRPLCTPSYLPSFYISVKDAHSPSLSPTQLHLKTSAALRVREDENVGFGRSTHPYVETSSLVRERHVLDEITHVPFTKRTRPEERAHDCQPAATLTYCFASPVMSRGAFRPPSLSATSTNVETAGSNEVTQAKRTEKKLHAETKSVVEQKVDSCVQSFDESSPSLNRFITEAPYSPTTVLLSSTSNNNVFSADNSNSNRNSQDDVSSALPPQRIRQHELQASDFQHEEVLGEGSYSIVSLATHRASGLMFALKEIDRVRLCHLQLEPQLRWEINLQRTLRHPNIVRLYSYFITPSCISLVLEYCRGGTLQQRVRDAPRGRLTEPQASRYARHVAKALTHLHSLGVAHRDLKLENVLIDEDGIAKLADFGWSRPVGVTYSEQGEEGRESASWLPNADVADGRGKGIRQQYTMGANQAVEEGTTFAQTEPNKNCEDNEAELEGRRTVCGTLDYLSPEMVSGYVHSFKTDVWSLGVMIAEMLTGAPPFYKHSTQQTLHAIRFEAPNLNVQPSPPLTLVKHSDPQHKDVTVDSSSGSGGSDSIAAVAASQNEEQARLVLSAGALSLIEAMLQKNPANRPSMCEVLRHPWLQKSAHTTH